jgi:dolichol-phosphate mannosyltransferase
MGLGFLSKYTIALLGLAAFVYLLLDPPSRRWLRRWEPYAAIAIAALVASPVVIWNAQHEWASFAFQTSRRLAEQPRFSLHKLIASGLVLMSPTGLVAVAAVFLKGRPRDSLETDSDATVRAWRFLQVSLFVPLTVFFFFSLRHEVKLDWTGAPWVAALPAVGFAIAEAYRTRASHTRAWLLAAWPPTVVILLLVYAVGLGYLVPGLPGVGYSTQTELLPVGWRDLGRQIDDIADDVRARNGGNVLVVGMDRYAIASELAFYSRNQSKSVAETSSAHLFDDMGLMYELWFPPHEQVGRTLLLVAWKPDALAAAHLEKHVDGLEPIREGVLVRKGSTVRRYYYRVAHGYRDDASATRVR